MTIHRNTIFTKIIVMPAVMAGLLLGINCYSTACAEEAEAKAEKVVPAMTVPADWKQQPGERMMRHATYSVGADDTAMEVVISTFPGDAGGLFANVNRWRGQVGLKPIQDKDELHKEYKQHESDGYEIYTMHLKGSPNEMLGAIIFETTGDRTWFIKATASPKAVAAHAETFEAFAKSFKKPK